MVRRYAILGTGAIGGYYGACLQQAGNDVHFLLRSDFETVKHQGLRIDSPDGNFVLPQVQAYPNVSEMPLCDVVIVALKTTQNHHLPQLLPAVLKTDGVVIVLQNGLNVEPHVARIVGGDRVIGGLCFICSNKIGPGHIQHLDYKAIALGEYADHYQPKGITKRLDAIAQDFEQAGIPIQRTLDLMHARWRKLLWNIPFNGLSVVLDALTDAMIRHAAILTLAEDLMWEVVAIAAAYGRTLTQADIAAMISETETMSPYRTSMKIDYDEKRPLEVDAIVGHPLRMAQAKGVETPKLAMLYQQLLFLNHKNIGEI
ncbi:MAG: putative 2-dehydropantoate 2-reductase [Elainellaceae cyanobacterium]